MMKKSIPLVFHSLLIIIFVCCGGGDGEDDRVADTVNPSIACLNPFNLSIRASSNDTVLTYTAPVGTDDMENPVTTQTEGKASGEAFPVGTTTNTFVVRDAAGNTASCSFDVNVAREGPSDSQPYFLGENPTPTGKKWAKVENMTDEFNDDSFDDTKWHNDPSTDGFGWIGRPPGLFEPQNVSESDGNLNVTVVKFDEPKNVNNIDFTHGGAIVRSKETGNHGMYFEARMKANKTVMSSTFWFSMMQNCDTGPVRKLELDVQECVGRTHDGTAEWAKNWDSSFHSNTWRHNRDCDTEVNESQQSGNSVQTAEMNHERFFVYGCWWKSPTEIEFYLDGEYAYSITPPTDFDIEGHITMAIETYDWNPIDPAGSIFETGSFDDLTTKYDWIRTWRLEDE